MAPGKVGRIAFDDESFERIINGETLSLDVQPDTTKITVSLDPRSRYHRNYLDIVSEMQRLTKLAPTRKV